MNKHHIIEEIKRTANVNGGALGRLRFFQETGIKKSDWKGKYWARWNDAVTEAGLAPNQKTVAYDDSFLIEKFITLIRETGRFPIVAEIRMKVRADASFPNDKTFARFGSKAEFAAKILSYSQARTGYEDVSAICAKIVAPDGPSVEDDGLEPPIGVLYLVKAGRYYKIGRSNSAGRREYELAIQLPEKAATIHAIKTDDPTGIDAYWHGRFADRRKNGEWFDLTSTDVKAFRRRKFM